MSGNHLPRPETGFDTNPAQYFVGQRLTLLLLQGNAACIDFRFGVRIWNPGETTKEIDNGEKD
jgi:hypothetical protein